MEKKAKNNSANINAVILWKESYSREEIFDIVKLLLSPCPQLEVSKTLNIGARERGSANAGLGITVEFVDE